MHSLRRCALAILALAAVAFVGAAVVTPSSAAASETFDDVTSAGYGTAIDELAERAILTGCSDREFCPDGEVTRGQMATLLAGALDLLYDGAGFFTDVDDTTHAAGINMLAAAGLTEGCAPGRFCPDEPMSRQELATFLVRGFSIPVSETPAFDDVGGVHAGSVNGLAAAGLTAGCGRSLVDFCPREPVLRWQAAILLSRSLGMLDPVDLAPLEERRAEQAEIDAERQRLEEERRREEERLAQERAARDRIWDDLAQCEAGGNWHINTGNGYYGGLQFALRSWRAVGGTGYPHQHSREEQIRRGEKLLQIQGWGAWPSCSRQLGYR